MIITARRHRAIQTDLRRNTYYRSLPKIKIKKWFGLAAADDVARRIDSGP
jgi:hypothetical protein